MAAGEDQPQPVVLDAVLVRLERVARVSIELLRDLRERRIESGTAAQGVDRLEPTGRNQPGAGIRGHAIPGPALDRGGERVVQSLLGEVEIAEQADQRGQDAARVGAVDGVHRIAHPFGAVFVHPGLLKSTTGRTSTLPRRADGILEAT